PNSTIGCLQRHIDRCQDGTLIAAHLKTPPGESIIDNYTPQPGSINAGLSRGGFQYGTEADFDSAWWFRGMYYSKDNGVTWVQMAVPLNEPTRSIVDFYGWGNPSAGPIRSLAIFVDVDDNIHFV